MHAYSNSNLSTRGTDTSGSRVVRTEAEAGVRQPSTSAGFSQRPGSPVVAALPPQPLSAADVDAAFSPGSERPANVNAPQGQEARMALSPFAVADKAHAQVQADIVAGNPPLNIDTARIFQLQRGEVAEFRARNGLPPPARGKGSNVTLAGTARHFGNNRGTLQTYVNEQGVFTDKAERSLDSNYKDYC